MYPVFIDAGYMPSLFWDLSIGEIIDLIDGYARKQEVKAQEQEMRIKEKILLNSVMARQIGEYVGLQLGNKNAITPIHELFPSLFDKETESEAESEDLLMINKARMEEYAFIHNRKFKKGGEKNSGRNDA